MIKIRVFRQKYVILIFIEKKEKKKKLESLNFVINL